MVKLGESTRQLEDVAVMLRSGARRSTRVLTRWIEALGLDEVWKVAPVAGRLSP
jgi:hypothetical protein